MKKNTTIRTRFCYTTYVQCTVHSEKSVWDPDAFFGRDFKVGLDRISNSM